MYIKSELKKLAIHDRNFYLRNIKKSIPCYNNLK
jgi:hypothetical protein